MKLAKSPSMPFYGKDIYTDVPTLRLSFAAQGFYVRLLWWQWSEGSIPDDITSIADVIGRERELRKLWPDVKPFFAPVADQPGYLANERLEQVRAEMVRLREKRGAAGSKGGSKKVANRVANGEANATPAFAVASAVASAIEEIPFTSKSRSSRCNGSDGDGSGDCLRPGWTPPWSERQFQYKADKIAQWVKHKVDRGVLPETDDFAVEFEAEWGMSYDRWMALRPACESFFSHRSEIEAVHV